MSDIAQNVLKTSPQIMVALAKATHETTKAILDLLKDFADLAQFKSLQDHALNDGELNYLVCKEIMHSNLDRKLTEQGIPHAMMQDANSGLVVCVFRDSDRETVQNIKNQILEEEKRISRVSVQELYRMNTGKNVISFSDLSETQVKLFQEEAKKNNFVMAAQKQEDGSFKVFVSEKNTEKAKQALNDVVIKSSGVFGKLQEQQKTAYINNIKNINEQLKDPSKEFFIVSGTNINEFIHINKQDFQHMRNGNLLRYEQRDNGDFVNNVHYQAMGLINPVILSKEEFDQFKELVDKVSKDTGVNSLQSSSKLIQTINSTYNGNIKDFFDAEKRGDITYSATEKDENKRLIIKDKNFKPQLSKEEIKQLKLENEIRELISAKMSLDNGNQPENLSSFYNNEVSFSEFFAHETVNDIHDTEELEKYKNLINKAKEFDALPDEDKECLRSFVKEIYQEREEHHYSSEYVDKERLARDDLDEFIDSHESDGFNTPNEPNFDNHEI